MIRTLTIACVALLLLAAPASAQTASFTPDPVDLAAAKKEGAVTWYTSTPIGTAQKIASMFQAETGIKVELFRSGGSAVLRRFMQEMEARRVIADVMTISDPAEIITLVNRDLLVPFRPRHFDKIRDEVKHPKGYHVAQRVNLVGIIMRADKNAPVPKNWTDLTDPKYKGLMVMPDPSYTAIQLMVIGTLSKKYGWEFYEKLRKNDIMIVQGNQQVSDNIKRGERLIAVGALDSYAADDRKAGHPIVTILPEDGTFVIPSPTAVIKGSPNPNAAKALAEFMIGDAAQSVFPADGGYAARKDIPPPADGVTLDKIKIIPVDYDYVEKESARIKKRFNEVFQ